MQTLTNQFDMHIPMALEAASNTSLDFLSTLTPSLGDAGASFVLPWGYSDGSDDGSVSVGTYEEIVAGEAGSGSASAGIASASAPSSASAISASASIGTMTNADLVAVTTSSSSALAGAASSSSGAASGDTYATATADAVSTSTSTSASGKKCRRRRSLGQRDTVTKGIKAHKARRGGHSHDHSSF